MDKIKNYLTVLITLLAFSLPMLIPATAAATCDNIQQNITSGVQQATNNSNISCGTGSINNGIGQLAATVVNILSFVVGAIAVIMIVYAGFRYITSGGDSNGVSSAKNTLIYAIVGIVIVALAQLIVRWVLSASTGIVLH